MENYEGIRGIGLLGRLADAEYNQLMSMGTRLRFGRDEKIFSAGMQDNNAYLLLEGRVKIYQASAGREMILWFCLPGEIFGLSELVSGGHREVNALACRDVQVLAIPYESLNEFIEKNPAAALHFIDLLAGRVRTLSNSMTNFAIEDVSSRIVKQLFRLCKCYGQESEGMVCLPMYLTHQELADMVGTSRQTVTMVLGELRRQGVIEIRNHIITVMHPEQLVSAQDELNFLHFQQTASSTGIAI